MLLSLTIIINLALILGLEIKEKTKNNIINKMIEYLKSLNEKYIEDFSNIKNLLILMIKIIKMLLVMNKLEEESDENYEDQNNTIIKNDELFDIISNDNELCFNVQEIINDNNFILVFINLIYLLL